MVKFPWVSVVWYVLSIVMQFDPGGGGGGGDRADLEKIKILTERFKIIPCKKIPEDKL